MGSVYKPSRIDPESGKRLKYRCWRIAWTDETGRRRTEKAYTDKAASEALLRRREQEAARRREGLPVPGDGARQTPAAELIDSFVKALVGRGSDEKGRYVYETRRLLGGIFDGCGWRTLGDVRRDGFERYLAGLAQSGSSPATRNQRLAALRSLVGWCMGNGMLAENPIAGVKPARVGADAGRRIRRAYGRDELKRILAVAPEPRKTLYLVAALSGLRKNELKLLEKQDFTPDGKAPRWHLRAHITKGKRLDELPMVPDLVPILLPVWQRLLPSGRVFGPEGVGAWPLHRNALAGDLAAANVPARDERGRVADFHSFRYTFCALMAEALPIQKVKHLMRHASITLTADLYTALGLEDLGADVWRLPAQKLFSAAPAGAKRGKTARHGVAASDAAQRLYERWRGCPMA